MSATHLLLLRHGQTVTSEAGLYTGRTNSELSTVGKASAAQWARTFLGSEPESYHSPLHRAAETARLAGLASTEYADLAEWDLGELEGESAENYRSDHPTWSLFRDGAPGGESPSDVHARVQRVQGTIHHADAELVVLVSHGQFLKALAASLLELPPESATRLSFGPARAALFSWRNSLRSYALAGWNRTPTALADLLGGNN